MAARRVLALLLALSASVLFSVGAHAELPDPGKNTVSVGPIASAGIVSQGVAAYDPAGTQASADSRTNPSGPTSAVTGGASDYTYRPLSFNQIPVAASLFI